MASKRRNMFHKNKTQETTEKGPAGGVQEVSPMGGFSTLSTYDYSPILPHLWRSFRGIQLSETTKNEVWRWLVSCFSWGKVARPSGPKLLMPPCPPARLNRDGGRPGATGGGRGRRAAVPPEVDRAPTTANSATDSATATATSASSSGTPVKIFIPRGRGGAEAWPRARGGGPGGGWGRSTSNEEPAPGRAPPPAPAPGGTLFYKAVIELKAIIRFRHRPPEGRPRPWSTSERESERRPPPRPPAAMDYTYLNQAAAAAAAASFEGSSCGLAPGPPPESSLGPCTYPDLASSCGQMSYRYRGYSGPAVGHLPPAQCAAAAAAAAAAAIGRPHQDHRPPVFPAAVNLQGEWHSSPAGL
ncbi:hypothetical protein AAG570_007749 [Ranatra chinensis]|uniref:Uncharacterized protein n=1 Tax=Ranatra chinensis TaxID=642074 RepID=A0ABD0XUG9_9HEMI